MLALKIAWRYLRAKKSHNAVNIITIISVAGVAVATMAMVAVLSIFNGFSDLALSHMAIIDPQFKAIAPDNRVFAGGDSIASRLGRISGVRGAVASLQSRALLVGPRTQTPVVVRGVGDAYGQLSGIRHAVIDGTYATALNDNDTTAAAVIAVGVANKLLTTPDAARRLSLYVPRRNGRINPANPAAAFRGTPLAVSAIFTTGQNDYDGDFIITSAQALRTLLEYDSSQADAIEIFTDPDADPDDIRRSLANALGPNFTILDAVQQHAESFRMITIEKWITFMMLIFILVIALFNIVSTLSLLVIEKRDNMRTLSALGAPSGLIRRVFILEGWLVTVLGGAIGMVLGIIATLLQQHLGLIKLAGDSTQLVIDSYPVRLSATDLLATAAAVLITGLLASQSTRLFTHRLSSSTPTHTVERA